MQAEQVFLDFDNFHLYDDQIMSAVDKRMTLLVSSCWFIDIRPKSLGLLIGGLLSRQTN